MEDEYQRTLKGKVKILYQLEKWQDVIALCEQYGEKYGKDVEIDMLRFKCERHLQKIAPDEDRKPKAAPAPAPKRAGQVGSAAMEFNAVDEPLLLTEEHQPGQKPGVIIGQVNPAHVQPEAEAEIGADEPFSPPNELIITDPFAEPKSKAVLDHAPYEPYFDADELIISEPASEDEPVFSLAGDAPPVIAVENAGLPGVQDQAPAPEEEMAIIEDNPAGPAPASIALDFDSSPPQRFDVEPELTQAPAAETPLAAAPNEPAAAPTVIEPPAEIIVEKPAQVWQPADMFKSEEKDVDQARPSAKPDRGLDKTPALRQRFTFSFKHALLVVLLIASAAVLWLSLSGKLDLTGGGGDEAVITPLAKAAPAQPRPAAPPPAARPVPGDQAKATVKPEPATKAVPATEAPPVDADEKLVNDKIRQARELLKNNDVIRALAVVLEAKKIKPTEPLRQLEELITSRIREDENRTAEQKQAEQNLMLSEEQAYDAANAENTVAAWETFLQRYPQGERAPRARGKIVALEKKAAQLAEQEFQAKIVQAQKLKLRSGYLGLNQAEANEVVRRLGRPAVRFEAMEHGGTSVIVDYSCGLMWTLWNKPMAYDKARWWANRIYAGYSGWRLPTVDEALTLMQIDKSLYANLPEFVVWTGDSVSDQVRAIWGLRLPQGQLLSLGYDQIGYVWAVRKAGK